MGHNVRLAVYAVALVALVPPTLAHRAGAISLPWGTTGSAAALVLLIGLLMAELAPHGWER